MRSDDGRLVYETPKWMPYDADELARIGAPDEAVKALSGRGLPHNAYEVFVRDEARELEVAELPGCGSAAFLAAYTDSWNSFWLSLADGSVWLRWGAPDEPAESVLRIDASAAGLQGVLEAWCDLRGSGLDAEDGEEYEDAVVSTVIRAVAADPEVFEDDEGWWSNILVELESTLPGALAGDAHLFQLVSWDEAAGEWVLDYPGVADDEAGAGTDSGVGAGADADSDEAAPAAAG